MIDMNVTRGVLLVSVFCFSLLIPGAKSQTPRPIVGPVIPVPIRAASMPAPDSVSVDDRLLNGILELLRDAVITDVGAEISLEKTEVSTGRVRLSGVVIENFRIGLRLNARGTKRLVEMLAARNTPNGKTISQAQPNQFAQILEILKLGIFNRLDISLRLKSLRVRELAIDADKLHVGGLLVTANAQGHKDSTTTKLPAGTLRNLIEVLRRTSLSRVEAHAGLDKLSAQHLRLVLSGTALEGLSVGLSLRREDA